MNRHPILVLLLSGKRKSGKDFVSQKLLDHFKSHDRVFLLPVTISAPLKQAYAEENDLNYEKLLDSSEYKEIYRQKMIEWSDTKRDTDPGYFCRLALNDSMSKIDHLVSFNKFLVLLVTDIRRKTDVQFFNQTFPRLVRTIRVEADELTRRQRNWVYTKGVDDVRSECDLDDYENFDFKINNNSSNNEEIKSKLNLLINLIENYRD